MLCPPTKTKKIKLQKVVRANMTLFERKCILLLILEKSEISVDMMTNFIMQKDFVIVATINMVEIRSHGIVPTKSFTLLECAKIVTLTTTTEKGE